MEIYYLIYGWFHSTHLEKFEKELLESNHILKWYLTAWVSVSLDKSTFVRWKYQLRKVKRWSSSIEPTIHLIDWNESIILTSLIPWERNHSIKKKTLFWDLFTRIPIVTLDIDKFMNLRISLRRKFLCLIYDSRPLWKLPNHLFIYFDFFVSFLLTKNNNPIYSGHVSFYLQLGKC